MAPPHAPMSPKHKGKTKGKPKAKPAPSSVENQHGQPHLAGRNKKALQSKAAQKAGQTKSKDASSTDTKYKVHKEQKKKRKRGGRGRGGGKKTTEPASTQSKNQDMSPQLKHEELSPAMSAQEAIPEELDGRHLLTLPAEIRLTIFEMALTEEEAVIVDKAGFTCPALTRVCRQLRSEAMKVWLQANVFILEVDDFSLAVPRRWMAFLSPHDCEPETVNTALDVNPSYNWTNLLEWAMASHDDENMVKCVLAPVRTDEGLQRDFVILSTVCLIAMAAQGQPWMKCKAALDMFRLTLMQLDEGWK